MALVETQAAYESELRTLDAFTAIVVAGKLDPKAKEALGPVISRICAPQYHFTPTGKGRGSD